MNNQGKNKVEYEHLNVSRKEAYRILYQRACRRFGRKNLRKPHSTKRFTYNPINRMVIFWYNLVNDDLEQTETVILK